MTQTVTEKVRAELRRRLLALDSDSISNITQVCDPVSIRSADISAGRIAVLWTYPGSSVDVKGNVILWDQSFGIDLPIAWSGDEAEAMCDRIRIELAAAFSEKISFVRTQSVSDVELIYPEEGSYGAVSLTLNFTYVENIK